MSQANKQQKADHIPAPDEKTEAVQEKVLCRDCIGKETHEEFEVDESSLHSSATNTATRVDRQAVRDEHYEPGDEIYDRFSYQHKILIVAILCLCSFLGPISSTSILAASPEVVAELKTSGAVFDISNALYIVGMSISPLAYGPIGQSSYGRKRTLATSAILFTSFSLGTAVSPNLAAYFVFRFLTALNGTSFFTTGGSIIGDIYRPIHRGTAYGWLLAGSLTGPVLGPVLGGVLVTHSTWRSIFWLQTAMAGLASVCVVFLLPETSHTPYGSEFQDLSKGQQARAIVRRMNPLRVLRHFRYPNLIAAALATGVVVWNMYSLLTPIQYVLNPRFHLSTPLQGALFYIAPGCGYLFGTLFGGRWADCVTKRYIQKRNGERIPEDRLRSCLTAMGMVSPACMLIYGWSVEKEVGGIPLPVIAMFVQGIAQTFCLASLNTYCVDVKQQYSSEIVAGNYMIRYMFAAGGTAACLPIIDRIGVGWFSTISAGLLISGAAATFATSIWGKKWREWIDSHEES